MSITKVEKLQLGSSYERVNTIFTHYTKAQWVMMVDKVITIILPPTGASQDSHNADLTLSQTKYIL